MRKIIITNFRCYEKKIMSFRRGINLLIGDNSVGKTSLLRACNLVINAFFSGYSDENTVWKSAANDDFRERRNEDIVDTDLPINITFWLDKSDCPDIVLEDGTTKSLQSNEPEAKVECARFYIEKKSKKNARNLITGINTLKDFASSLQNSSHIIVDGKVVQKNALPLFAYFTTEDIHTTRKFDKEKKKFKKYPQKPSFGYFESYDSKGLLDCWLKRLLVLKEAKKGEQEIECVRKAVISALGPDGCNIIDNFEIRHNDGDVFFHYCDGRDVRSDLLSDGYRRLVSIVVDLAFRCALLNKVMYGDEAFKSTHGTVIIDEIDEHLHPELQVRILKALHETFPNLQFIVSTHAPLVMSSVENNEDNVVYRLEYENGEYSHKEVNTYGLDANLLLKERMKVPIRDIKTSSLFEQLDDYLKNKDIEHAKSVLHELENLTDPQQPELVRVRAIINRLELIGR
ncbi:AAA family ATPase [uncultured Parabacteroides sp.]|uniref:AAA family ATPase n=1 Tax=uncultured Parabacteroides sp. TaxID=512312 RepID=UPI0025DE1022|nr:AAA family ATPase [uncultured Parabacteroides sp.]